MLAKLHTFALLGIDALPVEVDVSPGALWSRGMGFSQFLVK
jgi:hypothetical protein